MVFLPYKSLAANESLLAHAMTVQSRDSTCNSLIYTYPFALGNKSKDSMINETTHTNDINNREDPTMLFKVCSKLHKSFACVVLRIQFMSIDQIEKRSHALFSGGNSKFDVSCSHNCCFDDVSDQLVPCRTCNNKSLKREDSNKCSKC